MSFLPCFHKVITITAVASRLQTLLVSYVKIEHIIFANTHLLIKLRNRFDLELFAGQAPVAQIDNNPSASFQLHIAESFEPTPNLVGLVLPVKYRSIAALLCYSQNNFGVLAVWHQFKCKPLWLYKFAAVRTAYNIYE